jgi:hypothetical protein
VTVLTSARPPGRQDQRSFQLQRAQPAMNGLIDGSLSTLAPDLRGRVRHPPAALRVLAGLATALGAGVSMALTCRGNPAHPLRRSCAAVWRTSSTKRWTMAGFLRTWSFAPGASELMARMTSGRLRRR